MNDPKSDKWFLGNLDFRLRSVDLREELTNLFGLDLVEAKVIVKRKKPRGYGFCTIGGTRTESEIASCFVDFAIGGRVVDVQPARDRNASSRRATKKKGVKAREKTKNTAYLQNIPFEYDEERITTLFPGYTVQKVRLVRNGRGESRGFAFIDFSSEKERNFALSQVFSTGSRRLLIREAHVIRSDYET